ncbi:unnamed protein product [Linum trigynum]|uniref:Uncharacterized protein n=1 Tax=Linum trigynum TaxID=586398 RepID=A0AAV2DB28_9ROSI
MWPPPKPSPPLQLPNPLLILQIPHSICRTGPWRRGKRKKEKLESREHWGCSRSVKLVGGDAYVGATVGKQLAVAAESRRGRWFVGVDGVSGVSWLPRDPILYA